MSEIERIRKVYETVYHPEPTDYAYAWHPRNRLSIFYRQHRERAIVAMLNQHQIRLEVMRMLDIGSGGGNMLRWFADLGVAPHNLFGVELMAYRAENARVQYPNFSTALNNAEHLPFANDQFDLVTQFTVFSSILSDDMRARIAAEMTRVLRRNGLILWYDMQTRYPSTSNIQGIGKKPLLELFPGMIPLEIRSLHHWLAPITARRAPLVADLLEYLPFTGRTHLLALLQKS